MGTKLTNEEQSVSLDAPGSVAGNLPEEAEISVVPWLDVQTAGLVRAITVMVARCCADVRAVILYGSIARHQERSLDDEETSDVDLLFLVDLEPGQAYISYNRDAAIFESVGLARDRYPYTPREVQVMLAWRELEDWDPTFVESVARDGILLWARGPLPSCLAAIEKRSPQVATSAEESS